MRKTTLVLSFIIILLISTLTGTIDFSNYLYINVAIYLELAFGICFALILIVEFWKIQNVKDLQVQLNIPDLLVFTIGVYYFVLFLLSNKFNNFPEKAIIAGIVYLCYFIIRFSMGAINTSKVRDILYILVFIGVIETIHGLLQITGLLPNIYHFKFGGAFGNPGDLANLLTVSYTIALGLYFYEEKKTLKYVLLVAAMIQLVVIIYSCARTAWIASLISSAIIFFNFEHVKVSFQKLKLKFLQHKFYFVLIFLAFFILFTLGSYKLYCFKQSSADGRIFVWKLSNELVFEKPLFGHGYNSFPTTQRQKQIEYFKQNPTDNKNGWLASEVFFTFNDYLQLTVELGGVFLMLFLLLLLRLFFYKANVEDSENKLLFIGRLALSSILICMVFSYPLQNPTILLCSFILIALISNFDRSTIIKFEIGKKISVVGILITFILSGYLTLYSLNSIKYGLKWKHAAGLLVKNPHECANQYNEINEFLKHNISFVNNYVSILYNVGDFEKCIDYFNKNKDLCLSCDLLLMIGKSYEEMKEYSNAEEYYKNAAYLIPHRFIPKYQLFKLYQKIGDLTLADRMALEIRNMKIKVYSNEVKNIKTEVNEYLSSKNTLISLLSEK